MERFWLQSSAVVAVLAGLGLAALVSVGNAMLEGSRALLWMEWLSALALVASQVWANYRYRIPWARDPGVASWGCGVPCGRGADVNPPYPCSWDFCPCLGSGKGTFHIPPRLAWPQPVGLPCLISLKIAKRQLQAVNGGVT